MSKFEKLLIKIIEGLSDKNIRFSDVLTLLQTLGFEERVKGSHHIFFKEEIEEIINVQSTNNGQAKAYQVKQIRELIIKYQLHKPNDEEDA